MIFLDINTFYGPKSGGSKTFYNAKIDYFLKRPDDTYFLVYPGKGFKRERKSDNVTLFEFYGKPLGGISKGYRLLLDYPGVWRLLRKLRPDVVETGDPYLSALFSTIAPMGARTVRGSFYHTDSVDTYVRPWIERKNPPFGKSMARAAEKLFYFLQAKFDATLVTSRIMEEKLHHHGVQRTRYVPFGTDPLMMEAYRKRNKKKSPGRIRLLYAGRLEQEKGIDLLIKIIPRLLENPDVYLSVAGRGLYEDELKAIDHHQFEYLGYISSRTQLAEIFSRHQIFLAPGPYETFGFAALEAMASGQTVVGPDKGGVAEMLTEYGSSSIFKAGDARSFLDTIGVAMKSDLVAEAAKSHAFAGTFGCWDEAIDRMITGYKELVSANSQER